VKPPAVQTPEVEPNPVTALSQLDDICYIKILIAGGYSDDGDPEYEGFKVLTAFYDSKSQHVEFQGISYKAIAELYSSSKVLVCRKEVTLNGAGIFFTIQIPYSQIDMNKLGKGFGTIKVSVELPNRCNYQSSPSSLIFP